MFKHDYTEQRNITDYDYIDPVVIVGVNPPFREIDAAQQKQKDGYKNDGFVFLFHWVHDTTFRAICS